MDNPSPQEDISSSALHTNRPLMRIYTLGPFHIELVSEAGQIIPLSSEALPDGGLSSALALLKFLISQEYRFAPSNTILTRVFNKKSLHHLNNVVYRLRLLFRSRSEEGNFLLFVRGHHEEGNGYRLADYPYVWVDADAAIWNIEQAILLERFGENAVPFWEVAYHLCSRGIYLPEELYCDWSQTRRAILCGHYRQCIHRFSQLLWDNGAHVKAEFCLRNYWMAHPMDEDALCLLMKMLAEQERYQEALEYKVQANG